MKTYFGLGLLVTLTFAVLMVCFSSVVRHHTVLANNGFEESNCPASGNQAEPFFVGPGTPFFSRNQNLCLPKLAPVGGSHGPVAFIVQGVEPGIRVDSQGTIYIDSIRGVPGGADLWRWNRALGPYTPDGGPNGDGTLPFKYEGQPDNCGIFLNTGCANNVGSPTNLGVAPGGGDADIAVNGPDSTNFNIPNLAFVSLSLADVTAAHSTNRGDNFTVGTNTATTGLINLSNPLAAAIPGDDRMWIDAVDDRSTVYMAYHDLATFNIDVQRSTDGGFTYASGAGVALDAVTYLNGGTPAGSGNIAAQIRVDNNTNACPSRGNLYQMFGAADNATGNISSGPLTTAYVGVSTDAKSSSILPFTFTDYKIFTSPPGSPGATNGIGQVFPALATDNNGFVYAVWSDNNDIYFSSSGGQGVAGSWTTPPVRVNQGATTGGKSNVFPWVAADANGHVVVVWLGETNIGTPSKPANSNNRNNTMTTSAPMEPTCTGADAGTNNCWAKWNVYAAETVNGNDAVPTFTQYTVDDHQFIHSGTVSTGGLGGNADRNLADFFQVALDPQHRANITFADDHVASPLCGSRNNHDCRDNGATTFRVGVPYFTRQLSRNPNIVFPGGPSTCFKSVSTCTSGGGGDAEGDGDERGDDGHEGHMTFQASGRCHTSGEMDFEERDTGEGMRGTVDAFTVAGNTAIISGPGTLLDGTPLHYTAVVLGNGNPAVGTDLFAISWITSKGSSFHTSGVLTAGNIVVHAQ